MHNGGVKSFDFHSSPRMIPHICKPQVQFIELSIEQFVPRRKKAKDDATYQSSYLKKISCEESALLARYFHPSKEGTWRPSIICFPHFQAFPSRVYRVQHSFKTTAMLIDAMQHLQVLSCSKAKKACLIENETASNQPIEGATVACHDSIKEDFIGFQDATSDHLNAHDEEKVSDSEPLSKEEKKGLSVPDLLIQKPSHCFLFGEDFVTVDAFGSVCIASVPVLPVKRHQVSKVIGTEIDRDLLNNTKNDGFSHKVSGFHNGIGAQLDAAAVNSELRCTDSEGTQKGHASEKFLLQTPVSKGKPADLDVSTRETPPCAKYIMQASLAGECRGSLKDIELSPRLAHFIEEGIVPESPAQISHYSSKLENTVCLSFSPGHNNCGSKTRCYLVNEDVKNVAVGGTPFSGIMHDHLGKESLILCHVSPNITKLSGLASKELSNINKSETGRLINTKYVIQRKENVLGSAVNEEIQTPLAHPKGNSSSEDWQINSDEAAKSVTQAPKYKRLCKYKDIVEKLPCNNVKENFNCSLNNTNGHATRTKSDQVEHKKGKKEKAKKYANTFIDEEAEVSEDAAVSDDEEDNGYEDEYDDSFIDDRVNPSETGTQATNGGDMMAFYRRSLLTQSPIEVPTYMVTSHESASPRTAESGSCSLKHVTGSHQSSQYDLNFARQSTGMNSVSHQLDSGGVIVPTVTSSSQMECLSKLESRKRKLNFHHVSSITATNLQQQHAFQLEHAGEASWHHQSENTDMSTGLLCDDDFYRGLDLDELEAQATELLRNKSELSIDIDKAHRTFQNTSLEIKADAGVNLLSSPSFDLGV